jgi:hypothetical protein
MRRKRLYTQEVERARNDATSLGNVLLRMGVITEDDLREAVHIQKDRDRLLGKLFVLARVISPEDLETALSTQADLRHGKISRQTQGAVRIATSRTRQAAQIGERVASLGGTVAQRARTGQGFPAVCCATATAGDDDS